MSVSNWFSAYKLAIIFRRFFWSLTLELLSAVLTRGCIYYSGSEVDRYFEKDGVLEWEDRRVETKSLRSFSSCRLRSASS